MIGVERKIKLGPFLFGDQRLNHFIAIAVGERHLVRQIVEKDFAAQLIKLFCIGGIQNNQLRMILADGILHQIIAAGEGLISVGKIVGSNSVCFPELDRLHAVFGDRGAQKQNVKGVVRIVIVVGRELFRVFAHENSFRVMETKAGKKQKQGDTDYVFENFGFFHMVTVYHNVAGSPML